MTFNNLTKEELEERIKTPWHRFSMVGCVNNPGRFNFRFIKRSIFKSLVEGLKDRMKNELKKRKKR